MKHVNVFMTPEEVDKLFNQLDSNGNFTIDYTEFVAAAVDRKKALDDVKIKNCFDLFDKNKDGKIELQEFKELL